MNNTKGTSVNEAAQSYSEMAKSSFRHLLQLLRKPKNEKMKNHTNYFYFSHSSRKCPPTSLNLFYALKSRSRLVQVLCL